MIRGLSRHRLPVVDGFWRSPLIYIRCGVNHKNSVNVVATYVSPHLVNRFARRDKQTIAQRSPSHLPNGLSHWVQRTFTATSPTFSLFSEPQLRAFDRRCFFYISLSGQVVRVSFLSENGSLGSVCCRYIWPAK